MWCVVAGGELEGGGRGRLLAEGEGDEEVASVNTVVARYIEIVATMIR